MTVTRRGTLLGFAAFLVPTMNNTGFAANPNRIEVGKATFYKDHYEGKKTASGQIFRHGSLTAAHRTAPFGTLLRVTRLDTGSSVVVKVNDRLGKTNAVVDLSKSAARAIGITTKLGQTKVSLEYL
jgi:rare lipoprotein A